MALIAVPVSLGSFRNIEFAPTFVLAPVIAAALFILLVVGSAATAVGKHVDTCHMWDGTVVGCPVTY